MTRDSLRLHGSNLASVLPLRPRKVMFAAGHLAPKRPTRPSLFLSRPDFPLTQESA
jgi:hypothetical protein